MLFKINAPKKQVFHKIYIPFNSGYNMTTSWNERQIFLAYHSYNPDEDPSGEIGHRLADAVTGMARSTGKSINDWLFQEEVYKGISQEEYLARDISNEILQKGIPLENAHSLIRKALIDRGYSLFEMKGLVHNASNALNSDVVEYATNLLSKYHLPSKNSSQAA